MRRLRNAFVLGVLVGLVIALARAVGERRRPPGAVGTGTPALSRPPPVASTRAPGDDPVSSVPTPSTVPSPVAPAPSTIAPSTIAHSRIAPSTTTPSTTAPSTTAPSTTVPEVTLPPVEVDPLPPGSPADSAGRAPVVTGAPMPDGDATWVAPVEGACPDGYPVKAKEASRIFHVPGGLSYDRTRPERCYPSPAAAEADGFRAAKR
ncbi:hypothetical protein [Iamia sp.]|uniref:sunset domain-containing protein n=1 Tax=Iamia sp. TaxID=2722710 RepID=UPI002CDF10B3|nr:hypothetical protein [Iamia sp.]HXH58531.1 hypothetical protein [Iamia sp.]